jgi:sporulation protein YlmC with PRC-barrel domain
MEGTTPFTIGADVSCADGVCGKLQRVVIDPVARTVTHLIVEPAGLRHEARLVPLDLVDTTADGIRLRCTAAELGTLDPVEVERFIEGTTEAPGYGPQDTVAWPYYGLRGTRGDVVRYDAIPLGDVEVRRGDHVHATDGNIGRVEGLAVEPGSGHVTHVLLQEGHLWGRKQVAIPIGAVARADDGIRLSLTKQEVEDLPPVDIDR